MSNEPGTAPQDHLIWDEEAALSRLEGDRKLLCELAALFLDSYPTLLREIRQAVERGDSENLTYHAHTLKGSVSNFAAGEVHKTTLQLEMMGRSGNLAGATETCRILDLSLEELRKVLAAICGNEDKCH